MKVVSFACSPRHGGNTEILMEQGVTGAREAGGDVEVVELRKLNISPCLHCDGCLKEGTCVIDDDMQQIYPKLREADRLILASPVFFMGPAAQTKIMIDRCQALWALKYVLKQPLATNSGGDRKGIFLSVGGTGFSNLFEPSRAIYKSWFTVIDVKFTEDVTFAKIDEKGAIKDHPTALKDAFEAGKRLVS